MISSTSTQSPTAVPRDAPFRSSIHVYGPNRPTRIAVHASGTRAEIFMRITTSESVTFSKNELTPDERHKRFSIVLNEVSFQTKSKHPKSIGGVQEASLSYSQSTSELPSSPREQLCPTEALRHGRQGLTEATFRALSPLNVRKDSHLCWG